jgi:3-oxoacyl-[acyl-carrier-protein] synthase III
MAHPDRTGQFKRQLSRFDPSGHGQLVSGETVPGQLTVKSDQLPKTNVPVVLPDVGPQDNPDVITVFDPATGRVLRGPHWMFDHLFSPPKAKLITVPHWGVIMPFGRKVTNEEISKEVGVEPDKILATTGFRSRYRIEPPITPDEAPARTVEFARDLTQQTLQVKGWQRNDVDVLVVAGSYAPPGMAHALVKDLKLIRASSIQVDAACAGGALALGLTKEFEGKRVLLIAPEVYSPYLNGRDRTLFADMGAGIGFVPGGDMEIMTTNVVQDPNGAAKLKMRTPTMDGTKPNHGIIHVSEKNDTSYDQKSSSPRQTIYRNHTSYSAQFQSPDEGYFKMDGPGVFRWGSNDVIPVVVQTLGQIGLTPADVNYHIFHQANGRFMAQFENDLRQLGCDISPLNLPHYNGQTNKEGKHQTPVLWYGEETGNAAAASVIMAFLRAKRDRIIQPNDVVALTGFGAGLITATTVVRVLR